MYMKKFIQFIREQGVVGLAIGFIFGGAITKLVTSLVENIINPLMGMLLNRIDLSSLVISLTQSAVLKYGAFLSSLIDFILIAFLVYFVFQKIGAVVDKKWYPLILFLSVADKYYFPYCVEDDSLLLQDQAP